VRFEVRCVAPGDASVRIQVMDAATEAVLRAALQAQGMVVLNVRQRAEPWRMRRASRDYSTFCREIRTLVKAGMTVVEAVDTLAIRNRPGYRADDLAAALRERLLQGQSLSGALSTLADAPAVLIAAVKSGERTSNLVDALDDYLRFDGLTEQLRRKVVSAAIYPALVMVLGVAISLFLMMVVMPNFARMYQNLRAQATGINALVIEASQLLSNYRGESLLGLCLLLAAVAYWVYSGAAKRAFMSLGMRVSWIRTRVEDFQLAMMYQALAVLLKGGYPMLEAMEVAASSALAPHLREALTTATQRVAAGAAVGESLSAAGLCDEVDRRLMTAAERNGDFFLAAEVVSRIHGERFELFVDRMTRIVEPVLLLAVALMVGSIVVMMYLPVFDMATRLR